MLHGILNQQSAFNPAGQFRRVAIDRTTSWSGAVAFRANRSRYCISLTQYMWAGEPAVLQYETILLRRGYMEDVNQSVLSTAKFETGQLRQSSQRCRSIACASGLASVYSLTS